MKNLAVILFGLFLWSSAGASHLQVTNVQLVDRSHLSFDISWTHSWNLQGVRPPFNHDAVWCFLKYRKGAQPWQHLSLDTQSQAHMVGDTTVLQLKSTDDGMGVFVLPADTGAGPIPPTRITLALSDSLANGFYDIRAFGIEMVHIPEDTFYLGDTVSINTLTSGDTTRPYRVTSGQSIPVGNNTDQLSNKGQYPPAGDIPSAYPNGYEGFYCMKYEISQQQYADFLNTLTYTQQVNRTAVAPDNNPGTLAMTGGSPQRNGIVIEKPGQASNQPAVYTCDGNRNGTFDETDDGQNRACNFLSWGDVAAYLDWAGLRPMTELEYEKICRGPGFPVAKAMAWGTSKAKAGLIVQNDGKSTETVAAQAQADSGIANFRWDPFGDAVQGPFRVGFNANDTSDRLQSGSCYYGVMEMSGNVWETCVTIDTVGLVYTETLGDGSLSVDGQSDMTSWPQSNGEGAGLRGGGWNSGVYYQNFRDLAISDRFYAGQAATTRRNTTGGRGVR